MNDKTSTNIKIPLPTGSSDPDKTSTSIRINLKSVQAGKSVESFPNDQTFLILEDMDHLRSQMISDLKSIGVEGKILEAPCVQDALKLAAAEKVQFFISDWNLPDGTGLDFLKKVRSSEKYKTTPFIVCTTNDEIQYFLDAVANGANDFIVKPWTVEELKKKITLTWNGYLKKRGLAK